MSNSIVSQVPKNLLFRYRIVCRSFESPPTGKFVLPETHALPDLGAFENQRKFADVRVGWCQEGLFLSAEVTAKAGPGPGCRETQLLESDGMQVWVDTRDTRNVASGFQVLPLVCVATQRRGRDE